MKTSHQVIPLAAVLTILFASLFGANADADPHDGFFSVTGGQGYYRVVGNSGGVPLLLLHGGPGMGSRYFESISKLGDERRVIFYDQLGSGLADRPEDRSLYAIDRFVDEIDLLLKTLELDKVILFGHSWGGTLAFEFYRVHPDKVAGIIFASPLLDSQMMEADIERLVSEMPKHHQNALRPLATPEDESSAAYAAAVKYFNDRFTSRLGFSNWPESIQFSPDYPPGSYAYRTMVGETANDFVITGVLKDYSAISELHSVSVPSEFIVGEFDYSTPVANDYFASLIPGASVMVIGEAAHMWFVDRPIPSLVSIRQALSSIEASIESNNLESN